MAGICWSRLEAELDAWWTATGQHLLEAGRAAAAPLGAFCGVNATSSTALKKQVDHIGFDRAEGFPVSDYVSDDELLAAQNLSITLQEGAFATAAARTYLAGSLPATLLANMRAVVNASSSRDRPL